MPALCRILFFVFLLFLSACSKEELLVSSVSERDSVQIAVLLEKAGIACSRTLLSSSQSPRFQITVSVGDYAQALNVIDQHKFPKNEQESLESFTRPRGFAPSAPEIAALRLDQALSLELERMISALPNVLEVRAVVRMNFLKDLVAPRAVVLVRQGASGSSADLEKGNLEKIILQSIPALKKADLYLQLDSLSLIDNSSEQDFISLPPFGFRIKKSDRDLVERQLMFLLAGACLVAGLGGLLLGWGFSRKNLAKNLPSSVREELGSDSKRALN